MNIYFKSIILIIFLITNLRCTQDFKPDPINLVREPYKFKSQINQQFKASTEQWKIELAAWDYSYIGEYTLTLQTWDIENQTPKLLDSLKVDLFNQSYKPQNAIDYISKIADTSQIVIINEAHQQPLHRVFTTRLLRKLYNKGFRHLGIETLDDTDKELNTRKYPILSSGWYSVEPQYGNLIRKALEIGYHVFPYELMGKESGKEREIAQAKNIQQEVTQNPNGKFLIHCGFDHAAEGSMESWGKAMAGRVHEFTGINPLTINQIEFTERSANELNHPILQQLELEESSVFLDENKISFKYEFKPDRFDIMVFHPKTKLESGRPNWLFKDHMEKVNLDLESVDINFPILIFAYKVGEDYKKAVPVDVVQVDSKKDRCTLALERGEYYIKIKNQDGENEELSIEVN